MAPIRQSKQTLQTVLSCAFFGLAFGPWASAQGSAADYERAANLRQRFRGLYQAPSVEPTWIDGSRLWWVEAGKLHIAQASPGFPASEFDPKEFLDGARPLGIRPAPESDGALAVLTDRGVVLQWKPGAPPEPWPANKARPFHVPVQAGKAQRSVGRASRAVEIVFTNASEETMDMVWVDSGGGERGYGRLKPGGVIVQGTFEGHVFGFKGSGGLMRGWVRVGDSPGLVTFGGKASGRGIEGGGALESGPRGPRSSKGDSLAYGYQLSFVDGEAHFRRGKSGAVVAAFSPDTEGPVRGADPGRFEDPQMVAPGGRTVAFLQSIRAQSTQAHFVESAPEGSTLPVLHTFNYRRPGDEIDQSYPVLVRLSQTGKPRRIRIEPAALLENAWSISSFQWSADGSRFTFYVNERGHRRVRLVSVDARTGRATSIIEEAPLTFVDYAAKTYMHRFSAQDDGSEDVLWMTERSGWNHLILVDLETGKVKREVTRGQFVVRGVDSVDDQARTAIVRVMGVYPGQDPYHVHYAKVAVDTGEMTMLTRADGTHTLEFAPGGGAFIDRWSRVDQAPVTELGFVGGGESLELSRASTERLEGAGWRAPERFHAKGRDGDTDIWGIVIRPTHFDKSASYPVIEQIYAGPHDQHVPKSFSVHRKAAELAELGFVVVQIDGMGTNWRSKSFHDVAWKNLGDAGFPDRVLWLEALAKEDPALDLSRVGIYGGSAGGQNAMRALIDYPDTYHAAVADCGCHDNRVDKIWWNELWMSWPLGPHYDKSSNAAQAHRMGGKLMLVVGEMDRNVDPASTMQVVDALVKADKDFDLLVIPGAGHGAAESAYGTRRRRDFFVRNLLKREPRWN